MENDREITIRLNNAMDRNETVMLFKTVAGMIRNGRDCRNGSGGGS